MSGLTLFVDQSRLRTAASTVNHLLMKSIKIFLKLCDMNLKMLFIYRASFLISLVSNVLFVLSYILFIEVLFLHVDKIGNLAKGETLLVMAFFYLFQNLSDIFYRDNFERFSEDMRRGTLDMWISKPAPSRLLSFFHTMRFDYLSAIAITATQFWFAFQFIEKPFRIELFLAGILLSLVGVFLMFSIFSIISTCTFWIQKNETLYNVGWHLTQVARYPRNIYTKLARVLFTYIIPLSLIANIPTEITVNIADPQIILIFIGMAIGLFYLSLWFWNFGLKRYTSAG